MDEKPFSASYLLPALIGFRSNKRVYWFWYQSWPQDHARRPETVSQPGGLSPVTDLPKAEDWGDAQKLEAIRKAQRAFGRKEFQDLLFECHTILRDVQKANPISAFDTISKILFTKMYVEHTGTHGTFTIEYLDQRAQSQIDGEKPIHELLFDST